MNRFMRFLIGGALAAVFHIAVRFYLSFFVAYELAVFVAYMLSVFVGFIFAKIFAFSDQRGKFLNQLMKFYIVNIGAFFFVWGVSVSFYRFIFPAIGMNWNAALVSHAIGVASPIYISYFFHTKFSFSNRGSKNN